MRKLLILAFSSQVVMEVSKKVETFEDIKDTIDRITYHQSDNRFNSNPFFDKFKNNNKNKKKRK